jgi:hypothetical protein
MGTVIALVITLAAIKALAVSGQSVLPSAGGVAVPLGLSFLTFELIHVAVERRHGRIAGDVARGSRRLRAVLSVSRRRTDSPVSGIHAGGRRGRALGNVSTGASGASSSGWPRNNCSPNRCAWPSRVAGRGHAGRGVARVDCLLALDLSRFSAYSDIAIGISRLFGIEVPENFRWPYWSVNITEFWERWHISLSHWIRDYVFVPLGARALRHALRARPVLLGPDHVRNDVPPRRRVARPRGELPDLGCVSMALLLGAHHLVQSTGSRLADRVAALSSRLATLASRA